MTKVSAWLKAARLRTLPLSVSGILMGAALAGFYGYSDRITLCLALLTTIGFQVTSNFANDYGDGVKGTDGADRIGPTRALQGGLLERQELKRGIFMSAVLSLAVAAALLYYVFRESPGWYFLIFGALGIASIWASIAYTVGENAYGYRGLGDLFVFCFFGLLSVLGSMFLFTKFLTPGAFLAATGIGLLSTAVLNLNNLRDSESDRKAGKNTLVVSLGVGRGKIYHHFLLLGAFTAMFAFICLHYRGPSTFLCLLAFIPIFIHLLSVRRIREASAFDPELKKVALSTFLLAILCYLQFNYFL